MVAELLPSHFKARLPGMTSPAANPAAIAAPRFNHHHHHHLLLLPLLLLLHSSSSVSAAAAPAALVAGKELKTAALPGKTQVLHLAVFLPYTYSNSAGNGFELALVMGLEAINADPAVLPGVELRLLASNTGCSAELSSIALLKQMLVFPSIAGIIGDVWCSGASMGIATNSAALGLYQVSGGNASPGEAEL